MKRTPLLLAAAVMALAVLAVGAAGQKAPEPPKKPDIVGTWVGYAVAPGMRFELTAVFDKGAAGYTGKLSDVSGALAETPLREIVFKDGKLTFEFDLVLGMESHADQDRAHPRERRPQGRLVRRRGELGRRRARP